MCHYEDSLVHEMINKQHNDKQRQLNEKAEKERQRKKEEEKGGKIKEKD